jgi:nitroreductase
METIHTNSLGEVDTAAVLTAAATTAALAPSIHNTQPWRWRVHRGYADLYAEPGRQLANTDPDRRLLTVSCGTALHHARVALAAAGVTFDVDLLPTDGDRDHIARITVTGRTAVTDAAMRHYQTIQIRHTDRRPLLDETLPAGAIEEIRKIAGTFAIGLHPLNRTDMFDLAAATSRAQADEIADPATLDELASWTGPTHPAGAGIPDANIPDRPAQTTVPSRDFGHAGTLPLSDRHDNYATYVILYGLSDEPESWIRAGEALSAVWLYATEHNIAVLPLSAAVEEPASRQVLHRTLAGLGYAHLGIRFGIPDPDQTATPRTPRLPGDLTIEVVD